MDHLSYPKKSHLPELYIPYLDPGEDTYDLGGFQTFPCRRGWEGEADCPASWLDAATDVVAMRAQQWLYFGLLYEVLPPGAPTTRSQDVFIKEYRDGEQEKRRLNSWSLQEKLKCLQTANSALEAHISKDLLPSLIFTRQQVKLLHDPNAPGESSLSLVILSITLLLEFIEHSGAVKYHYQQYATALRLPQPTCLIERFLRSGRCPSLARTMAARCTASAFYYISSIENMSSTENMPSISHGRCNEFECVANTVDGSKVVHTARCDGDCERIGPDLDQLSSILRKGSTPVLYFDRNADQHPGSRQILLGSAEADMDYVCLSHIWSQGLGSIDNKLPHCQVERVFKAVSKIPVTSRSTLSPNNSNVKQTSAGPPHIPNISDKLSQTDARRRRPGIWLDPLCIPSDDATLRQKSIDSMARIYACCESVLVLDAGLQKIPRRGRDMYEVYALILTSEWSTRCWTLQEAALARKLYFLFADGIFDAFEPYFAHQVSRHTHPAHYLAPTPIRDSIYEWWGSLPSIMKADDGYRVAASPEQNFVSTWTGIGERHTSKPDDVHIILSIMTDMNVGEITPLNSDGRLKATLRAQRYLPLEMLAYQGSRKNGALERMHEGGSSEEDALVDKESSLEEWQPPFPSECNIQDSQCFARLHAGVLQYDAGSIRCNIGSSKFSHLLILTFNQELPWSEKVPISIEPNTCWLITQDLPTGIPMTSNACLVIFRSTWSSIQSGRGFRCVMVKETSRRVKLRYVCPISYSTTHEVNRSANPTQPLVAITHPQHTNIELDCGMHDWPLTTQRRTRQIGIKLIEILYARTSGSRILFLFSLMVVPAVIWTAFLWFGSDRWGQMPPGVNYVVAFCFLIGVLGRGLGFFMFELILFISPHCARDKYMALVQSFKANETRPTPFSKLGAHVSTFINLCTLWGKLTTSIVLGTGLVFLLLGTTMKFDKTGLLVSVGAAIWIEYGARLAFVCGFHFLLLMRDGYLENWTRERRTVSGTIDERKGGYESNEPMPRIII
ncbi:hypothetical protein BP6252_13781 [Coleophoma cylindrospora]|uniref:Heterokaryon incompatibility domain-containing protein n=1 Tax=Coleophoma cylindrospora TaxID=1849047 RepID=A0A3D8Q6J7_9HELO|nr:hypothetical protein BP6252_13781 [Coleophoma cylindrospora]